MTSRTNKLGFWPLVAIVCGNMIGVGTLALPTQLAKIGSISILGWALTGLGAIAVSLVFAYLSRSPLNSQVTNIYGYIETGLGERAAFRSMFCYLLGTIISNVALVGMLYIVISQILIDSMISIIATILILWCIVLLLILAPVTSLRLTQTLVFITKILFFLGLSIAGLFYIDPTLYQAFNVSQVSNLQALANSGPLTLYSFLGLESACFLNKQAQNPNKDIPRAMVTGILIAVSIYLLSITVLMGNIPMATLANSLTPFEILANKIFGVFGSTLIKYLALLACIGSLNGWIFGCSGTAQSIAEKGLMPSIFAYQNSKNTPTYSLLAVSSLMTLGFILGFVINKDSNLAMNLIVTIATCNLVAPYLDACLSYLTTLRKLQSFNFSRLLIGIVAFTFSILMIIFSKVEAIIVFCMVYFLSGLLYAVLKRNKEE